ncbi:hypothetical protein JCM13580A_37240 [Streptomyces drozdowiczii]
MSAMRNVCAGAAGLDLPPVSQICGVRSENRAPPAIEEQGFGGGAPDHGAAGYAGASVR